MAEVGGGHSRIIRLCPDISHDKLGGIRCGAGLRSERSADGNISPSIALSGPVGPESDIPEICLS